jgi:hypothetical protein
LRPRVPRLIHLLARTGGHSIVLHNPALVILALRGETISASSRTGLPVHQGTSSSSKRCFTRTARSRKHLQQPTFLNSLAPFRIRSVLHADVRGRDKDPSRGEAHLRRPGDGPGY